MRNEAKTLTFPKPSEEVLERLRNFMHSERKFEKHVSDIIKETSLRVEEKFKLTVLDHKFLNWLYRKYGKYGYADSNVFKMKYTSLLTEVFEYAAKRNQIHSSIISNVDKKLESDVFTDEEIKIINACKKYDRVNEVCAGLNIADPKTLKARASRLFKIYNATTNKDFIIKIRNSFGL